MDSFLLNQNIANFARLLQTTVEPAVRETVGRLPLSHRKLALFKAKSFRERQAPSNWDYTKIMEVFPDFADSPHPLLVLHPGPKLPIVDINGAYARATMTLREDVRGRSLFEVFPDNPSDPMADGVANLSLL